MTPSLCCLSGVIQEPPTVGVWKGRCCKEQVWISAHGWQLMGRTGMFEEAKYSGSSQARLPVVILRVHGCNNCHFLRGTRSCQLCVCVCVWSLHLGSSRNSCIATGLLAEHECSIRNAGGTRPAKLKWPVFPCSPIKNARRLL